MKCITIHEELFQVAEVELIYKSRVRHYDQPQITCSRNSFAILIQTWDDNRIDLLEQFKVLFLNRNNQVLGIYEVSTGGIHGTVADVRLIFGAAIKAVACSIIVAHNHPSGTLDPSEADKVLTKKLSDGGKLLDIKLLDHLIVTRDRYLSFADEGLL